MSRIALVIPNRNGGEYFADLLAVVERLVEWPDVVIIVDGQSSDGGWEQANDFAQRNAARGRIQLESRTPRGIYDAWNRGIALADTEWIHIVCSDDLIQPDAYRMIRERLDKADGVDLETFDCALVDAQGCRTGVVSSLSSLEAVAPGMLNLAHYRPPLLEALLLVALRSVNISFVGVVIPARLAKKHPFASDCGSSGDVNWLLHLATAGVGVNYTPSCIGSWRSHGAGATLSSSGSARALVHRSIRQRHLPAVLRLAGTQLDERQQRALRRMATGDLSLDFFEYLADAKKLTGWARLNSIWRAIVIAVTSLPRHQGWRHLFSKRRFIQHLQSVDAKTLLAGTDLIEWRPIKKAQP